jgi:hypothetical protein
MWSRCFALIITLFLFNMNLFSQFCIDTITGSKFKNTLNPSIQFSNYANQFLKFAEIESIENIDFNCKGVSHGRAIIKYLDKGLKTSIFSKNELAFSIDSYFLLDSNTVNFGLLEIVFKKEAEVIRSYEIFKGLRSFHHSDEILRIFHLIVNENRLLLFHTATPESNFLRKYFKSLGITDFIFDE